MTKLYLLLAFILMSLGALGQNLVPNGDFEEYTTLPVESGEWHKLKNWSNVNKYIPSKFPYGSPDYFHIQAGQEVRLPNLHNATVNPYSGSAVAGFLTFTSDVSNFREYLSVRLTSAMEVGTKYKLSFWVSNGGGKLSYGTASNNIGVYFSTAAPRQFTHEPIKVTPQLEVKEEIWSNEWQEVSFDFTADSAYTRLTIGNFYTDTETSTSVRIKYTYNTAYYYLDKVEVVEIPTLKITGQLMICRGDSAVLKAVNGTEYSWAESTRPGVILSTAETLKVAPKQATTYVVSSSTENASFTVQVNEPPLINLGADTTLCPGQSLYLNPDVPGATYRWQDNSTVPNYTITKPGLYWVEVTLNGCSTRDELQVSYKHCEITLVMPNIFTPNHDGLNDSFRPIKMAGIEQASLFIYNRWGNRVYASEDLLKGWDGQGHGAGSYFWQAVYIDAYGSRNSLSGTLTLVR
ncbi:gliding motility-associated C-terminal domain-containing protein [Pontibacter sp. HSC-36F09]|uniref:T9SS type B sorting domain-containing protein n=1 Tax=Pontibacter sp. HSC-36F09 TaxID=2910966 RepID=UPI0020A15B8B|nr:gliding motility-associated C-terminal domain-containing protein [Pontibacter sp. HSC-36F09]MCP2045286.1 gliding motility-associated-like protein [Pontibacter sp. HSC-36F09]